MAVDISRIWWLRLDHPLLLQENLGDLVRAVLSTSHASPDAPVFLMLDELVYTDRWDLWLKTFFDEQWPVRIGARSQPRPHAWLESLVASDPAMPAPLSPDKVAAFADELTEWIASGAVSPGRDRVCLRVHEPGTHPAAPTNDAESWWVELLLQDSLEPSLVVPIAELWAGRTPFPAGSVEETLRGLARMAAVAPELGAILDAAAPVGAALTMDELVGFVDQRVEPLAEVGIHVLLPAWWTRRRRVSLRARAKSPGTKGVVTAAGLDFDRLVSFTWEAALGDDRLTKADLARLQRAADAKQSLVQIRGEWVMVDRGGLDRAMAMIGSGGETTVGALVRSSLGLGTLDADPTAQITLGDRSRSLPRAGSPRCWRTCTQPVSSPGPRPTGSKATCVRTRNAASDGSSSSGGSASARVWAMTWAWARPPR